MMRKLVSGLAVGFVLATVLTAGSAANIAKAAQKNAPVHALKAGYNDLKFEDDFNSASTIDLGGTGNSGYKWYLDRPFGWASASASDVSVANSILTVKSKSYTHAAGWGISTFSVKGDTGYHFQYGYVEAKIRFNHKGRRDNNDRDYFPCIWSFSKKHTTMSDSGRWGEIDIFEAYTDQSSPAYRGQYVGTVHDHSSGGGHIQNGNNWINDVIKDSEWHVYGLLWEKGKISWYLDNKLMHYVEYSADGYPKPMRTGYKPGTFSILDSEAMALILGASENWPMEVDYVRVWEKGGPVVPIPEDTTKTQADSTKAITTATTKANQATSAATTAGNTNDTLRQELIDLTSVLKALFPNQGSLSDEEWQALTKALSDAENLINDKTADASRLQTALDSLKKLQQNLKPGETAETQETTSNTDPEPQENNTGGKAGNGVSAWIIVAVIGAVLAIAAGLILYLLKSRRSENQ